MFSFLLVTSALCASAAFFYLGFLKLHCTWPLRATTILTSHRLKRRRKKVSWNTFGFLAHSENFCTRWPNYLTLWPHFIWTTNRMKKHFYFLFIIYFMLLEWQMLTIIRRLGVFRDKHNQIGGARLMQQYRSASHYQNYRWLKTVW